MQRLRSLIVLPVLLLTSALAQADDAVEAADALLDTVPEETLLDLDEFESSGTLTDDELNSHRARENIDVSQITINEQDQDGDVTDNVAINTTNGDNLINGEAFSDSSGFMSTVQNTGNNVLIQNSTIINVSVETPTN